jgi:phosphoadenosine phosphosulfate reductase
MNDALQQRIDAAETLLQRIASDFAPAAFASSFGAEDMVLTDLVARRDRGIEIFTLDTGKLPEETHRLMRETVGRYGIRLRVYVPDERAAEAYVAEHGPDAFFRSVALRKACCHIRKVEPLRRALSGKRAWITGLRREQSVTRGGLALESSDAEFGLMKFNPLADWSNQDVWDYIRNFEVPYNALHDHGYPSIGCAPCTRAVAAGEDIRAGRWWWEQPESRECGLHAGPDGRRRRITEAA